MHLTKCRSVPKCFDQLHLLQIWICLKVDLIDRFWLVFSGTKGRVASTHFKYQSWSLLQIRKEDNHHHVHSTLTHQSTCDAIEAVLPQLDHIWATLASRKSCTLTDLKGLGVQLLLFTCSPSKSLHKANSKWGTTGAISDHHDTVPPSPCSLVPRSDLGMRLLLECTAVHFNGC